MSHILKFGDAVTSPTGDTASLAGDAASRAGDGRLPREMLWHLQNFGYVTLLDFFEIIRICIEFK